MKKFAVLLVFLVFASFAHAVTQAEAIASIDRAMMRLKLNGALASVWSGMPSGAPAATTRGNFVASVANGSLQLATKGNLVVSGSPLVVDVIAKPIGASLGRALLAGLKSASLPLTAGVALYEVFKELYPTGEATRNPDGSLSLKKPSPVIVCGPYSGSLHSTVYGAYGWTETLLCDVKGPQGELFWFWRVSGPNGTWDELQHMTTGLSTELIPIPDQEFIDAVANKSGWPSSSNLSKATVDAIDMGISPELQSPVVSGPSSIPGPQTVTNNPDGTTTTETKTNTITYQGDNITTNITTNISNYNPVTNNTTTSTSTTTNVPATEPTKSQCELTPDAIGCSKYGEPDNSVKLPTQDSGFSQITPVAFGSNYACPADLTFSIIGHQYAMSYSGLCSGAVDYVKPVLLVLAAALAAMIFVNGFKV